MKIYKLPGFCHWLQSACIVLGSLGLLAGCALSDQAPIPTPVRTPPATATPDIPTATPTLVVQRGTSPTPTPAPLVAVSTAAAAATQSPALPGRTTVEKPVGDVVLPDLVLLSLRVSLDRRHYAFVSQGLFGSFVIWDGRQGKVYAELPGNQLRMSDDGLHIAYMAHTADQWLIVKDEQEVYAAQNMMALGLSRDGNRLAHSRGSDPATILLDGKPGKGYTYVTTPIFSADGRHMAYAGTTLDAAGKQSMRIVRDGVEGKPYDSIDYTDIVFSPDGRHLAYPATMDDPSNSQTFVVADEHEQKPYDIIGVQSIRYSPDSSQLAYVAALNGQWFVVANEKEGRQWDKFCTCISYSPDSKHLAYQGVSRGAAYAVLDNQPGRGYIRILNETPIFSPDSRHSAFVGLAQDGWLLAIDGQEFGQARYLGAYAGMLAFSPDSSRIAYAALTDAGTALYVDGHPGNLYTAILAGPAFDAPQHLAYLALRDSQLLYVEENLPPAGAKPVIFATPTATATATPYPLPKYDLSFNMAGSGPVSIAASKDSVFHYRPAADLKEIQSVKSLTLHVTLAQTSGLPAPALMFSLLANEGGWAINGGRNKFNWGVNDIELQFPERYVTRQGDITLDIKNYGQQQIDFKSINFTLVTINMDGTKSTYTPQ